MYVITMRLFLYLFNIQLFCMCVYIENISLKLCYHRWSVCFEYGATVLHASHTPHNPAVFLNDPVVFGSRFRVQRL